MSQFFAKNVLTILTWLFSFLLTSELLSKFTLKNIIFDLIGNLLHWFKRKLTVILTFLSPYNFQDTVLSSTKICDFIRTPGSIIISNLEIVKRSLGNFRQLVGGGAGMHPHLPAWNSWIPSP